MLIQNKKKDRHEAIHSEFWSNVYNGVQNWIFQHLHKIQTDDTVPKYFFINDSGAQETVSIQFILKTLGYNGDSFHEEYLCIRHKPFHPEDIRERKKSPHALTPKIIQAIN